MHDGQTDNHDDFGKKTYLVLPGLFSAVVVVLTDVRHRWSVERSGSVLSLKKPHLGAEEREGKSESEGEKGFYM